MKTQSRRLFPFLLLLLLHTRTGWAYGLLTHEALIDASWERVLVPAIQKRFPVVPDTTLAACHAFAYGGAIVPDMGYFPMSNPVFSDLLHYVRTGAFVTALTEDAATPQESRSRWACWPITMPTATAPAGRQPVCSLAFPQEKAGHEQRPHL